MARRAMCRGQLPNGEKCHNTAEKVLPLMRAGGNSGGGLCNDCYRRLYGYTTENNTKRGGNNSMTDIRRLQTFSFELETAHSTPTGRVELMDKSFIPSHDCTVNCEYKSPIYPNAKPLFKCFASLDKLLERGNITINHTCGTHFHIGMQTANGNTNGMLSRMSILRRFNNSLFCELSDFIVALPDRGAEIFGRPIGNWARAYEHDTPADMHEAFINLQHDYSIEFRQCFFRNAAQYARCVRLCRRWAQYLCEFADAEIMQGRNATAEQRREFARQTSRKMIAEYQKAITQGFNYDKGK